jgi:hypothetical protein
MEQSGLSTSDGKFAPQKEMPAFANSFVAPKSEPPVKTTPKITIITANILDARLDLELSILPVAGSKNPRSRSPSA